MNVIELFNGCSFIGKFDNTTVVIDAQNRTVCEVHNSLLADFLVCDTKGYQVFSNMVVHDTHTGYSYYYTCSMYQLGCNIR